MQKLQQNHFEAILRAKELELAASLRNREGLAAETTPDLFDEIQRAADRALVIQTLDHVSTLLRDVRMALARIADGTYGQCLKCDEEINLRRLVAVPWARLCLKCQQEADNESAEERPVPTRFAAA